MLDGEQNRRPQQKLKERDLLLTGPGGSTPHTLRGYTRRSRWGAGTGPEHMPLLEAVGGMLWGSWVKARLVDSNQKV